MTNTPTLSAELQSVLQQSQHNATLWNGLGFDVRQTILQRWAKGLDQPSEQMVNFQCLNAQHLAGVVHHLPGPTGETNTLYCVGRGVFLVTADDTVEGHVVIGQIAMALACGNSVILSLPPSHPLHVAPILAQFTQAGGSEHVLTQVPYSAIDALLHAEAIAGVAYSGAPEQGLSFARQLATRTGPLAQWVAETDLILLPTMGSPSYCLRFITERTRTINITAVGGNATLLELGCGEA